MVLLVIGGTGMLGKRVLAAADASGVEAYAPPRSALDIRNADSVVYWFRQADVVINCAGVLPLLAALEPRLAMEVNGIAPVTLAQVAQQTETWLIHVSTDCVFDGQRPLQSGYSDHDRGDAIDDPYGLSKYSAEALIEHTLSGLAHTYTTIVRTSFVGPEHGLWRWFLDNDSSVVPGFQNALWSGSSADLVADALVRLSQAEEQWRGTGTVHVALPKPSSKLTVLRTLREALGGPLIEARSQPVINRWLIPTPGLELPWPTPAGLRRMEEEWRAARERD